MSTAALITVEPSNPRQSFTPSVGWAAAELRAQVPPAPLRVIVCRPADPDWEELVVSAAAPPDFAPEAFALAVRPGSDGDPADPGTVTVLVGGDDRGTTYALLELADVIRYGTGRRDDLARLRSRYERPHVGVRSISRMYTSQRLDRVWLHDRSFWDEYLTEIATHRYNRFTLAFGLGYDYLIDKLVVDNELYFLYPFVLDVPGHTVTVNGLTAEQRAANLASIQYVAAQAVARGLDFGLGLWNHAYRLEPAEPTERWLISGLTPENHAAYCADALALLLTEVPQISTLTFRVHFEGGVPEPTHAFWREVMSGIGRVDRTIGVDAHAKGINDDLLGALRSAGSPLTLSTKYWGEHMGLPYHQAAIREKEFSGHRRRDPNSPESGGMSGAETTRQRSFTRYGYADFARTDADYRLLHRIWPGTQRVLATPDPVTAAGIGRHATFAGSAGVEWLDALTFLGKKDSAEHPRSGVDPLQRELYADPELSQPGSATWRKYRSVLRVNGRLAYDPDADSEGWRRWYRARFGDAAAAAETAAAHAGRILPLITAAHAPSVAGNIYWPEMDTPIPLVEPTSQDGPSKEDHGWHLDATFDMTPPYTFGNTSPLDPELFASAAEYATDAVAGRVSPKYSPAEVAGWLDLLAAATLEAADTARTVADIPDPGELRRLLIDARIAAHLGAFFADKLRAATGWELHHRTGRATDLDDAVAAYRRARNRWADAAAAGAAYSDDLPFGQMPYQRGHWRDRLPAIDADLAAVEAHAGRCACRRGPDPISWVRIAAGVDHEPPSHFAPGRPLPLRFAGVRPGLEVILRYREVDQSQRWSEVVMTADEMGECRAEVPVSSTTGRYAVQYYVVLTGDAAPASVGLWPGLDPTDLSRQPYIVIQPEPSHSGRQ